MIIFQDIIRLLFSTFFIYVGVTHFINPAVYDALVPTYLPNPRFLHLLAGAVEIILGISLLTRWRSEGALLLAIFLVIVYLGNLHMWINDVPFMGNTLSTNGHILRLMAQIAMISYSIYLWRIFK